MNFTFSILFAFAAMLCWGIGDFFIQRSTRKIGDIEALAWIGIIGSIGLLPFAIKDIPLLFRTENLLLMLLLGIITFVAAIFNFEALKKGKLSIIDVVLEIELPITIVLSFMFFKETLTTLQALIICCIMVGIILIATKSLAHWKAKLERGVWIALIASIFMGAVNFLTASSSKNISPIMAVWGSWVIFTILCILVIWRREGFDVFISHGREFKWLILVMGIFDTVAWLFYSLAVHQQEIAITTAITESYPAIALFLGLWFNKEIIKKHQYIGAIIALACSVALALTVG